MNGAKDVVLKGSHNLFLRTWVSSCIMGGGFAYINLFEKPKYHYPLCLVFPSIYGGYHILKELVLLEREERKKNI
uniref:Transmembrane protein n=1 Tax=Marseillevirus LCMAC101 TaxID=2506602 RepID=A0A481YR34_9VIRU|nr:MAG: hypothetical protein LCMAC101_02230 [Marseillevirus LCMAC101]